MRWLTNLATSSIGAKVLMALTGVVLVAFVIGHMIGNLQVFAGREVLNDYAELLQSNRGILWAIRLFLLGSFVTHVFMSSRLTLLNQAARPVPYANQVPIKSTFTSRNMWVTGFVVLAFLVFHLLHFTVRITHPEYQQLVEHVGSGTRPDVFAMVVFGFSEPLIAISYVIAMLLLGLHLSHAISSAFQTMGLNTPKYRPITSKIGPVTAVIVVIGNVTMPLAILAGKVPLPPGAL